MSETAAIDLTPMQHAALYGVFVPYADRFESVGVYGSRVTGRARPGSDVDLVVYGASDDRLVGRLLTELEESDLSIFADVVLFERIENAKLRGEIARDAITLFTAKDFARPDEAGLPNGEGHLLPAA